MKFLFTLAKANIGDFYNYTQTNNTNDFVGYFLITTLIIFIALYAALYIPIKLYQINKNTKSIKEELMKINNYISKKNKEIEIIENLDIEI